LPVAVPHTGLSAAALRGVIESFVLREGTDYGERGNAVPVGAPSTGSLAGVLRWCSPLDQ